MGIQTTHEEQGIALLARKVIRPSQTVGRQVNGGLLLLGVIVWLLIESVLGDGQVHIKSAIISAWPAGNQRTSLPTWPAAYLGGPPLVQPHPIAPPGTPPLLLV
jgi:hypothetical protein